MVTKGTKAAVSLLTRARFHIEFVLRKLWWFDVVYPIALGMMLFGSIYYIVYGGRESSRLSLLAERFLLETTFSLTPLRELTYPGRVLTVSGNVFEINKVAHSHNGTTPDLPIDYYQKIIESLVDIGVKNIIVIWRSENHPQSGSYYRDLRHYLAKVRGQVEIAFVTNIDEPQGIKLYVGDVATIFDNLPCANTEQEEVQTFCPILPQSGDWIAQWMLSHLYGRGTHEVDSLGAGLGRPSPWRWPSVVPSWKTRYIPSTVEGYMTFLVHPHQIPDLSFSDALLLTPGKISVPEFAFVGLDLTGSVAPSSRPGMPIAIKTPYQDRSLRNTSFKLGGVPLHQYWANMGQTMLEGRLPRVASPLMVWSLNGVFAGVIVFLMFRYGGVSASVCFMLWCLAAPIINIGFLNFLMFYLPIFSSYYVGLSILIMSGFARLSLTTLARWRAEEISASHLQAADLKGNFISLLSHNLNTPIAKMQGLIELLVLEKALDPKHLSCAEFYISQIQLVIRSVLIATTLEEGAAKETPRNLGLIMDEFKATYGVLMRQIGIRVHDHPATATYDDLLLLPLAFDIRALITALAAALALGGMGRREMEKHQDAEVTDSLKIQTIDLFPSILEHEGQIEVVFEIAFIDGNPNPLMSWLESAKIRFKGFRSLDSSDFVGGVLGGLVVLTTDYYGGSIQPRDAGVGVRLGFVPKS